MQRHIVEGGLERAGSRHGIGLEAQAEIAQRGLVAVIGKLQRQFIELELVHRDLPGAFGRGRGFGGTGRGLFRRSRGRGSQRLPVNLPCRIHRGADAALADRKQGHPDVLAGQVQAGLLQADVLQGQQRLLGLIQANLLEMHGEIADMHHGFIGPARSRLRFQRQPEVADGGLQRWLGAGVGILQRDAGDAKLTQVHLPRQGGRRAGGGRGHSGSGIGGLGRVRRGSGRRQVEPVHLAGLAERGADPAFADVEAWQVDCLAR